MTDKGITNIKKMTFNDYKDIYSNMMTDKDYENLHKKIIADHREFASIYAIVVRCIVYHNEFFDNALRLYVNHLTNHPWSKREEFVERQAEYIVYVWKEKNPRIGSSELARYKQGIVKTLIEEDKKFDEYAKETTKTVNEEWDKIIDDRRRRLHDILEKMKIEKDSK
jgi:hypothetical protein